MTANDFFWAIKTTAKGKSSGLDGLPAEYYQIFSHKWARVYELIYASQFNKGRMTKFQRRAYISLLYKKGDRSLPSNYRPLTLLNHDAKFGPKIVAYRLRNILPKLLHSDQFGFTQGRSIRHALVEFQDLQQLAKNSGLHNAGAVLLDFAKAFDSVLWPALNLVLKHFGFGNFFRDAIKTFYKGTIVTVLVNGIASEYFELGSGVRQGDPLSPALFVLFLEPMLNFLRWKTGHLGINVPNSKLPHHLLAFADDCTGILKDLRHTRVFIDSVQYYSNAAGLTLNSDKTIVMPFQGFDQDLRETLTMDELYVVPDDGSTKLLGISQSPTLPPSTRFDSLITKMVQRCQLWKYRGRTIRGRAVILRTIVLPLFWYTAAVTPIPKGVVDQVRNLCKSFLFKETIAPTSSIKGHFPEEWLYWPSTKGGLGLPETATFGAALRLCTLRDSVQHACHYLKLPRWFEPAAATFSDCLHGSGTVFDILYVNMPRTSPAPERWRPMGVFWFTTLQAWRKLRETELDGEILFRHCFEMPIWLNFLFTVQAKKKPFEGTSTLAEHFRTQGYIRLRDFIERHGQTATKSLCLHILTDIDFASPRLRTLAASHFIKQLQDWRVLPLLTPYGPYVPVELTSATHAWSFKGKLLTRIKNRDFYRLLHTLPTIPTQPNSALEVDVAPEWDKMWRTELNLDKILLPILADLKFRLQHNGLNVRRKYRYHTEDTNCPHGCAAKETVKHLFWSCPIVHAVWIKLLRCIAPYLQSDMQWKSVVYLLDLKFTTVSLTQFGHRNLLIIFHIIRAGVLYPTWIHRNHRIFQNVEPSAVYVECRAVAYAKLHLRRIQNITTCPKLTNLTRTVLSRLDTISPTTLRRHQ
ncbi:RNA-dependent DNA polymerase [Phytophthora megakarya]|uniref:RNA-dependent DNA polymerase n=1 Tax=Phytophthora megakarya TaxID=4795 RepID=A0A225VPA3_9STRA|nr:RNA-dependent DNA polymerase [Phytophthora megakarya]